jgi:hypothetical protein
MLTFAINSNTKTIESEATISARGGQNLTIGRESSDDISEPSGRMKILSMTI